METLLIHLALSTSGLAISELGSWLLEKNGEVVFRNPNLKDPLKVIMAVDGSGQC